MGTQGMVTIMTNDQVVAKVVVGCEGYNADAVAEIIRKGKAYTAEELYEIARQEDFGCKLCRAIVTPNDILFKGEGEVNARYRDTFLLPEFNPRWACGVCERLVVVRTEDAEGMKGAGMSQGEGDRDRDHD